MSALPLEGMRCIVYQDPITCKVIEGEAVIKKILKIHDYNDDLGRLLSQCLVHFDDDEDQDNMVQRDISHLL
jgi:hypothetical protein